MTDEPEPEPAAPEPEPEPAAPEPIVRIVGLVLDCANPEPLVAFWTAALGYRLDHRWGQFVGLAPPGPGLPPLTFQVVPEPKISKNRMHLDLVGKPDRRTAVTRRVDLGATVLPEHEESGWRWNILADPGGNEFCVIGRATEPA
jgi:catechol 2,3-dioxygenase-like lactoylglutathione lyase family enzyme